MSRLTLSLWLLFFAFVTLAHAETPASPNENGLAGFAGYTGLWDMPTARVIEDWNVRMGTSASVPYYYYYATVGLFDRLEINGRLTGIDGVPGFSHDKAYGRYKDKAFDTKLLLLKEGEYWPALAVGANDIHGSGVFTSRYVVASKRFGPLELTFGLGQGAFAGRNAKEIYRERRTGGNVAAEKFLLSDDTKVEPFGGVELSITDNLIFSAEYTPIDYEKYVPTTHYSGLRAADNEAKIPFTFGFKYSLWDTLYLQAAYARGEHFSAGAYLQIPLEAEGPLAWKKEPPPVPEEKTLLKAAVSSDEELAGILVEALRDDGFADVKIWIAGSKLWVELTNNRYNSPTLAFRRVFLVVDSIAPDWIEEIYMALLRGGIFQVGLASTRENLRNLVDSRTDPETFLKFAYLGHSSKYMWQDFREEKAVPKVASTKPSIFSLSIKPTIRNFVNDPSGFLKTRLAVDVSCGLNPWRGALAAATYSMPFYNDITTIAEVEEPKASRTDITQFLGREEPHLTTYAFDQMFELPIDGWGRIQVGAFEAAYAGFGGELFRYFLGGRFGLGLEGIVSRKRDPDNDFKLDRDNEHTYLTYHLNVFAKPFPGTGVEVGLRIGQFLAGDKGVRIEVARTFNHFTLGAWLTVTDTSDFQSRYNRNYYDKGIYIAIPFSAFKNQPVKGRFRYAISPWTRDPGQMVGQIRRLFPIGVERETVVEAEESLWEMRQ